MCIEEMKRTARAFVLIEVELGKEDEVMEKVLKFNGVTEVHEITGKKDLLAVLEIERDLVVPSTHMITEFVTHKIAKTQGIRETETIIPTMSKIETP